MRIKKWVETSQEVELDVTIEEVISEIGALEPPSSVYEANRLLSTCIAVVMRVPDAILGVMTPQQRKVVAAAMREQADRYLPANAKAQQRPAD